MIRIGISVCLLSVIACGSSSKPKTISTEASDIASAKSDAKPASEKTDEKPELPAVPIGTAPIEIPNGVLYDGYILGGLPSKGQIDKALESDIESAMSLMSRDEPGISEIGPYAASQGFRYIRFSIAGPKDLTESMAWEFASTLPMLDKPSIIHSADGKRVAAIFALKAFFVDDLGAEKALAIGLAIGLGDLEEHVRTLLGLAPK
jgi:hypothetical protein